MKEVPQIALDIFHRRLGEYCSNRVCDEHPELDLAAEVFAYVNWHEELISKCQSPIEMILGAALLFNLDGYNHLCLKSVGGRRAEQWGGTLHVQFESIGYRADFAIECRYEGLSAFLLIECDGHDFHDRTKEQAARDRKRDREFMTAGHSVIRFTGSEIFKDAIKCAEEVEVLTSRLMDRVLAQAGVIHG